MLDFELAINILTKYFSICRIKIWHLYNSLVGYNLLKSILNIKYRLIVGSKKTKNNCLVCIEKNYCMKGFVEIIKAELHQ